MTALARGAGGTGRKGMKQRILAWFGAFALALGLVVALEAPAQAAQSNCPSG